ncbi:WapI family immunity protein [Leifsonia soli]|uniref:Uncharacterized protein n=1 Tax=Leifsonia soli TaxID=582665 RepID=A0A852SZN7_9MICO|nr:hypothetical protein [Leifsonia soli]
MRLRDEGGDRSVELRPVADDSATDRVVVDAVVEDGVRRWTLADTCLTDDEARDLAAWLAGIADDATAAADEWTALTFSSPVITLSGHRIPGGTVELRIGVLRMVAAGGGTADVVVGLRAPQAAVVAAARDLLVEVDALPS